MLKKMMIFFIFLCTSVFSQQVLTVDTQNLALNKKVNFLIPPNLKYIKDSNDIYQLTDGKTSQRTDKRLYLDKSAVGWYYGGRVNMALDLGKEAKVDEISIRFGGGSGVHSYSFPGWVEAFVSIDGSHYFKVAEFSRWNPGDFQKYNVPPENGTNFIHLLRFRNLNTKGRYVGIRFYSTALCATDELYVYGQYNGGGNLSGTPSAFSVDKPTIHFHKPKLFVAKEVPLPIPVGILVPSNTSYGKTINLEFDIPLGIELKGGKLGNIDLKTLKKTIISPSYYRIKLNPVFSKSTKTFGRIYLSAPKKPVGWMGSIKFKCKYSNWETQRISVPVEVKSMPKAKKPKRILTTFGWWSISDSLDWPDVLNVFDHIGINGFSLFSHYMDYKNPNGPDWQLLNSARSRGFKIIATDSPIHRMLSKSRPEVYCQFVGGAHGERFCPSYRGKYYRQEIQRISNELAKVKPDFFAMDIELWSGGPKDAKVCTRCIYDWMINGPDSWKFWQEIKGFEIMFDIVDTARNAARQAGGPNFETGCYAFRPHLIYHHVWNFDILYMLGRLNVGMVSTYTCLYPYHLGVIASRIKQDRLLMPKSDIMPWLTPGDAGTFPGEYFMWAMLECYLNGARGIFFWSGRVWDSETLIAYNKAVSSIASVEDIIVDGNLVGSSAYASYPAKVSGMKKGNEMVLIVSDYMKKTTGKTILNLTLPVKSKIIDLFTNNIVSQNLGPGKVLVIINFGNDLAKLLHIKPQ